MLFCHGPWFEPYAFPLSESIVRTRVWCMDVWRALLLMLFKRTPLLTVLILALMGMLLTAPALAKDWWNPMDYFSPSQSSVEASKSTPDSQSTGRRSSTTGTSQRINPDTEVQAQSETRIGTGTSGTTTPASQSTEDGGWFGWFKSGSEAKAEADSSARKDDKPQTPKAMVGANTGFRIKTIKGDIVGILFPEEAPQTVNNFVRLVKDDFYNQAGMKFHRVVPGFVIQTGDPTGTGMGGSKERIPLEIKNKLSHKTKGVLAMARGPSANSATSQFYITLAPQKYLDGKYAIFGQVIQGFDVLDKIKKDDLMYRVELIDASKVKPESGFEPLKSSMFASFVDYFSPSDD